MHARSILAGVALVLCCAGGAGAADQTLFGKVIKVKNNLDPAKRKVAFVAKELASGSTVAGNPASGGATFEVVLEPALVGDSVSQQCFSLPAAGWSAIGSLGWKYKDKTGANGAVKTATVKRTPSGTFILKVVALGRFGPITVAPPTRTAEARAVFRIGGGDRYCSLFGGTVGANAVSGFTAKNAEAPSSCGGAFLVCSASGAFVDGGSR